MRASPTLGIYFLGFWLLAVPWSIAQQQIIVSWQSKELQSLPLTVDKAIPVMVVVRGVNNILYNYEGRLTAHPVMVTQSVFGNVTASSSDPCGNIKSKMTAIDGILKSSDFDPYNGVSDERTTTPHSIGLEAMRLAFEKNLKPLILQMRTLVDQCTDSAVTNAAQSYLALDQKYTEAFAADHDFTFPAELTPLNNYTITIIERYGDKITDKCTNAGKGVGCDVEYIPRNNILSTSGGFLFSELSNRTYERRLVPNSTNAVLVVNNSGPVRTILTALINVKIPCGWVHFPCSQREDTWGWALSIGPALQLSGGSNVTKLGLFGGVSVHLWKYLFLTPGVHVGDFADFPAGFTQNRQAIPASFTGNLDPVTRISVRFAFGITFKGFNIPTGSNTAQGTVKPASAGK